MRGRVRVRIRVRVWVRVRVRSRVRARVRVTLTRSPVWKALPSSLTRASLTWDGVVTG